MINETKVKIRTSKAWGNTGEKSFKSKVFLPMKWLKDMGINENNKVVIAEFDRKNSIIKLTKYIGVDRVLNKDIERKITITFSIRGKDDNSYKAILGVPVKWVKEMELNDKDNLYLLYKENSIIIKQCVDSDTTLTKYTKDSLEKKIKIYTNNNTNFSIINLLEYYKDNRGFPKSYKTLYKFLGLNNVEEFKDKYF